MYTKIDQKLPVYSDYCTIFIERQRASSYFFYEISIVKIKQAKIVDTFFTTIKMDANNPLISEKNINSKSTKKETLIEIKNQILEFINDDILIAKNLLDLQFLLQHRFKNKNYNIKEFINKTFSSMELNNSLNYYIAGFGLNDIITLRSKSFANAFRIKFLYDLIAYIWEEPNLLSKIKKLKQPNSTLINNYFGNSKKEYEDEYNKHLKAITDGFYLQKKSFEKDLKYIKFSNYTLLDIETSSFDSNTSKIIELGVIKVIDDKVVDQKSWLVNPQEKISSEVQKLTGITEEMIENKPTIEELKEEILEYLGNDIITGYNVSFDISVIDRELNITICDSFFDILNQAKNYLKNCENHTLTYLVNKFDLKSKNSHRAIDDCLATKELLDIINKTAENEEISKKSKNKKINPFSERS